MPPKPNKLKLAPGQQTLSFLTQPPTASSATPLAEPLTTPWLAEPSITPAAPASSIRAADNHVDQLSRSGTWESASRRGTVPSRRAFVAAKWHNKHLWIVAADDGIYCESCKSGTTLLSGSSVFVTAPFTGTRPDKLVQH